MLIDTVATDKAIKDAKDGLKEAGKSAEEAILGILGISKTTGIELMKDVFSDMDLSDFDTKFQSVVHNAMLNGLLASDLMMGLSKNLTDTISNAWLDGVVTAQETSLIIKAGMNLKERASPLLETLKTLDSSFGYLNSSVEKVSNTMQNAASSFRLKSYTYYSDYQLQQSQSSLAQGGIYNK